MEAMAPTPRARHGNGTVREQLIEANRGLVRRIARRYRCPGLETEDLVQEGMLGLIAAVDRFDPRKETRFSAYATPWIHKAIRRAIAGHGRWIRLPQHVSDTLLRLDRRRRALAGRWGREPTVEELAASSGLPARRVAELLPWDEEPLSLEQMGLEWRRG